MTTTIRPAAFLLLATCLVGCAPRNLRGQVERSKDGRTYLVIEDANPGACRVPKVDGRPWPLPVGRRGPIAPGVHTIECGGVIEFEVRKGTTLHFDYWGP